MQNALPLTGAAQADVFAPLDGTQDGTFVTGLLSSYQIIRRNGAVAPFEPGKIKLAMMKAFLAIHGAQGAASASVRELMQRNLP